MRSGLLRHPLDKQVLVYDTRDDRVHLLDPTTACVLELLEEGGWTREGIAAEMAVRLDVSPDADLLVLALEELRSADLLDQSETPAVPLVDVTRRELMRKVAFAGAAAVLVPTIASLTATRGYAQGTAAFAAGSACTTNAQCASTNCCNGICSATGCPQAAGAICTANNQCNAAGGCCSGVCNNTKKGTGAACTGSDNGSCSNGKAKTAADATCCSSNCIGSCAGNPSTHSGTCA